MGRLQGFLTLMYIFIVTSNQYLWTKLLSLFGQAKTLREGRNGQRKKTVAFFHPYCNAGGGGERVLWAALRALQQKYSENAYHFVVFTGDVGATSEEILAKARNNFNIFVDSANVEFVFLQRRKWVEADLYPVFTLLGQSIGSVYLGLEALSQFKPDVFLDTMGYAFTLPLFKNLGGARVGAYVHYPTISTDMLQRVADRSAIYNNAGHVANSATLSWAKLTYYRNFAAMYCVAGRSSEVTMVNSSWTEGHILKLWKMPGSTFKVYPPCDVREFTRLQRRDGEEEDNKRLINLVSVAQFRPEKDHAVQVRAMKELKGLLKEEVWKRVKLVLLGSVRNEGDQERVDGLKKLAEELGVEDNVVFKVNFSFTTLKVELTNGLIGMHSMLDEHFGISVVECMAAGLLMLAHRSGGPLMDIVKESPENERTGFLAQTPEEYAQQIKYILELSREKQQEIRERARASVNRFSDDEFSKHFTQALDPILSSSVVEYRDPTKPKPMKKF